MEFKKYKLDDVCLKITDGSHYSPKNDENSKIYMLSVKDMLTYDFNYNDCKHISEEEYNKMKRNDCVPKIGDVLVAKDGSYLKEIFVNKRDNKKAILSSIAIFRPNTSIILPEYLCYLLKSPKVYNYTRNNCVSGSALPRIILKSFKNIPIEIATIENQTKIVNILSKLDKKIQLNNQINNNLYELSRTIFNEIYKKSENWHGYKIQDIGLYVTDYVANGSFKSLADNVKIYNTKNYALFVRNTDLKVNFTQERKYVDEHSYKFLNKSKLIGRELIISNVGDVGSVYLCPSYKIPMTLGNNVIMVNSKGLRVNYNYYLYYFFLSIAGQYLIDGITGGSAQPKFNKTDFRNSIIKIPSDDEIVEFNKKIIPLYDIIEKNIMENETLSKLRDTLLPKLMNGEIDLDKIEI